MKKYEKLEMLEEAQAKLNEGLDLIKDAMSDTEDIGLRRQLDAYMIPHLENWINGGNPYDFTLDKLIEKVESQEDEDDLDEDDEQEDQE